MTWLLTRTSALALAITIVALSAVLTFTSPISDVLRICGLDMYCFGQSDTVPIDAEWHRFDVGMFAIRAPDGTVVVPRSPSAGSLNHRLFQLTYNVSPAAKIIWAGRGPHTSVEPAAVGGRPAVLRTDWFPGEADPYFIHLRVPEAFRARDGQWMTLDIQGWIKTEERAWLVARMLRTVDFEPPFDKPIAPVAPRVLPPVIAIDQDSES